MDSVQWGTKSVSHHYETTDISSLCPGRKNSRKGQFPSNQPPGTSKANQPVISVLDGSGNLNGHSSEELFDDLHQSKSPRSPRTYNHLIINQYQERLGG